MNDPLTMPDHATLAAFGGFDVVPATFFIDRDGNGRHQEPGAMAPAEDEKRVR